ncbi:MAG: hypothetical protein JNJ46_12760 [Myxococcales bacterium]|nr:hypothetical protein [Myxococcales bacterium]
MKILVVSMSTWGEMGNWLSGRSLVAVLASSFPAAEVNQVLAETYVPCFAEIGADIKRITRASGSPEERFERYAAIMGELDRRYPQGVESAAPLASALAAELEAFTEYLRAAAPDLIIGTKGLICRICVAAARHAGLSVPVINYITNHGHFQFRVHHCPDAALHLVRFAAGQAYVQKRCGFRPEAVRAVGYVVAAQPLLHPTRAAPLAEQGEVRGPLSVIIVSNRGGTEYVDLVRHLVPRGNSIQVTFIAINDPDLCAQAEQIIAASGITNWRTASFLTQEEFFGLLDQTRTRGGSVLVSKASPNSIFEAAYFGIPMFLIRTGLPMEEWGADVVIEEKIGYVVESMAALMPVLDRCLDDRERLAQTGRHLQSFIARYLDQPRTIELIAGAVRDVLSGTTAAARAAG